MLLYTSFNSGIDGEDPAADTLPDTLVFALTGQSNMVGRHGPIDSGGEDATDANILAVNFTSGMLETAADPLDHFDETADTVGPGLSFAKAVLAAHPGKTIVLIPAADGGTGFFTQDWNRGDTLYESAVARIAAGMTLAQALDAGARLVGIIRIQGEKELDGTQGAEVFGDEFEAMNNGHIRDFRADLAAADQDTPFVYGGLPPDFLATTVNGAGVQAAIAKIVNLIGYTGYADPDTPSTLVSQVGDEIHYTAASCRTMGQRLAAAWQAARSNPVTPPTLPTPPAGTLGFHFEVTGIPDGHAIYEVSGNDLVFLNRRVYIDSGQMAFRKHSLNSRIQILDAEHPVLGSSDISVRASFTPGRVTGTSTAFQGVYGRWITTGNKRSFLIRLNGDDIEVFGSSNGTATSFTLTATNAVSVGTPVEVEFRRVGTAITLKVNGSTIDTDTVAGGFTFFDSASAWTIGDYDGEYGAGGSREIDMLLERITLEFL
jgi:Carbohydrate esterase, sialic acid-specific acetylesterase